MVAIEADGAVGVLQGRVGDDVEVVVSCGGLAAPSLGWPEHCRHCTPDPDSSTQLTNAGTFAITASVIHVIIYGLISSCRLTREAKASPMFRDIVS
jgi:hypothetical protein